MANVKGNEQIIMEMRELADKHAQLKETIQSMLVEMDDVEKSYESLRSELTSRMRPIEHKERSK